MLLSLPDNPCPDQAQVSILTTEDGYRLRAASWTPSGAQHGTVLMLQGRAECIEKYFEPIQSFLDRGFGVINFDWRGQGGSERLLADPMKGHIDHFEDYQTDLRAIRSHYAQDLQKPVLAFAHSMGGLILLQALHHDPHWAKAALFTAPMLDIVLLRQQPWLKQIIKAGCLFGFKKQYPPLHRSQSPLTMAFERNPLTRNRARFERTQTLLRTNPALALGMPTLGWLGEAIRAIHHVPMLVKGLNQQGPDTMLMIAPTQDRVTATEATAHFCAHVKRAELVMIENSDHEILMENDPARDQFWHLFEKQILPLF